MTHPLARRDDIEVRIVDDELVLYDGRTQRAYALHPFVARVWALCDGTVDVTELAHFVRDHPGDEPPTDHVRGALDALAEAGLLEQVPTVPEGSPSVTRGELVKDAVLVGSPDTRGRTGAARD
jgi:hypothetical protein